MIAWSVSAASKLKTLRPSAIVRLRPIQIAQAQNGSTSAALRINHGAGALNTGTPTKSLERPQCIKSHLRSQITVVRLGLCPH
jgi:hypothetical protein